MVNKRIVIPMVAIIVLACSSPSFSKEIPVNIKAENLKFSDERNLVTASGSVEIHLENLTILADRLEMETKSNLVTAEGNVKMVSSNYSVSADLLTYYTTDETSSFRGFKTVQAPSEIRGRLYLSADSVREYKNKMTARESSITTCDFSEPHYFAMAKKVEYYPDDKLIGFGVTFYEGWLAGTPVMWSPYVYYDLKKKRKKNWTFGHNEVEGDFIKTVWDSPLPWAGTLLFLDWMDKKGAGWGLQRDYDKNSQAYLYHIEEKDTGIQDWVVKLKHELTINSQTEARLEHQSQKMYLIPSGRTDQFSNKLLWSHKGDHNTNLSLEQYDDTQNMNQRYLLNFNHLKDGYSSNYSATMDQRKSSPRDIRTTQRLTHSQPFLFENSNFKTNLNYYDQISDIGAVGDERLNADYAISYSHKMFDLSFYEDYYFDLDGNKYGADSNLEYFEKQPEITLKGRPVDLKLFNLNSTLGYGWYHEVKYVPATGKNRNYAAGRAMASENASKTVPLPLGNNLQLGAEISQFTYEPGDQRYTYSESAQLSTGWWERLKNNINFSRGISEGNSPFFFDTVNSKYSYLKENLTLHYKSYFDWTSTTGYNFTIKRYDNYTTGMNFTPSPKVAFNWRSGFDQNNKKYLDLNAGLRYIPTVGLTLEANLTHDINVGKVRSSNTLIDWEIGSENFWQHHWHVKLGHIYDTSTQSLIMRDVMIVKDLHCWEVKYLYSDYRKEFSLTFTIKALPEEPFGYAPARGFYSEGFEQTIKEEFKQDSIRRY